MQRFSFLVFTFLLCSQVILTTRDVQAQEPSSEAEYGVVAGIPLGSTWNSSFGGIGMTPTLTNGVVEVESVIAGKPAEKAGLKQGDKVLEIDGKSVTGIKELWEAIKLIRGEPATTVTLTISRTGVADPFKVQIIREKIVAVSAKAGVIDDWCNLTHFWNGRSAPDASFKNRSRCTPWPGETSVPEDPFYWGLRNISLTVKTPDEADNTVIDRKVIIEAFRNAIQKNMMLYVEPTSDCKVPDVHVAEEKHVEAPAYPKGYNRLLNNVDEKKQTFDGNEDDTLSILATLSYITETQPPAAILNVSQLRWKRECISQVPHAFFTFKIPLNLPKEQLQLLITKHAESSARIFGQRSGMPSSLPLLRYRCNEPQNTIELETFYMRNGELEHHGVQLDDPASNSVQNKGKDTYYRLKDKPIVECKLEDRSVRAAFDGESLTIEDRLKDKTEKFKMVRYSWYQISSNPTGNWETCTWKEKDTWPKDFAGYKEATKVAPPQCATISTLTQEPAVDPNLVIGAAEALKGDPDTQDHLGSYLHYTLTDKAEAAKWYQKAIETYQKRAEHGDIDAQLTLANRYYQGFMGVSEDKATALKWWSKAAEQGNINAMYLMGIHFLGPNILDYKNQPSDVTEGLKWLRKAAELGNRGSRYALGRIYMDGKAISQDYKEAYFWSTVADDVVGASQAAWHLTTDDISQLQAKIKVWLIDHPAEFEAVKK